MQVTSPVHITEKGDYKLQGKEHGSREADNQDFQCFQSALLVYVDFLVMVTPYAHPFFSHLEWLLPIKQMSASQKADPESLLLGCDRMAPRACV